MRSYREKGLCCLPFGSGNGQISQLEKRHLIWSPDAGLVRILFPDQEHLHAAVNASEVSKRCNGACWQRLAARMVGDEDGTLCVPLRRSA